MLCQYSNREKKNHFKDNRKLNEKNEPEVPLWLRACLDQTEKIEKTKKKIGIREKQTTVKYRFAFETLLENKAQRIKQTLAPV